MAQKDLIPQNKRTKEEQKKIARMGGIASGRTRRAKADLRKAMQLAMETVWKDSKGNEATGQEMTIAGIIANLSDPKGRNWGKALDAMLLLTNQSLTKDQIAKIKAETALTKAKTKAIQENGGSLADIEDLTPLAELLTGGDEVDKNPDD